MLLQRLDRIHGWKDALTDWKVTVFTAELPLILLEPEMQNRRILDRGSTEHYIDAPLYDYEYRRRRADVRLVLLSGHGQHHVLRGRSDGHVPARQRCARIR